MTPYTLEQAVEKADEAVRAAEFSDKALLTETFLLVRYLVRHAADLEADRNLSRPVLHEERIHD